MITDKSRYITEDQLDNLRDFICEIDNDWVLRHMEVIFDDYTKTIQVRIDNINEQEYGWLKGI